MPLLLRHVLVVLSLVVYTQLHAQVKLGESIRLTGNVNAQYSFYNSVNVNNGFGVPTRPPNYPQLTANLSIRHKSGFSVPMSLYLSPVVQVFGVTNTPSEGPGTLNIFEYLSHPVNRVYLKPSYRKSTFHLGHFVIPYSRLSVGDIKVFGVGADQKLGQTTLRLQHGIIQPRVFNNLFNANSGNYRRILSAVNFSRKQSKKLTYGASLAYVRDQESSLTEAPILTVPQQSATLSAQSRYQFSKTSFVEVELANSAFAPNTSLGDSSRPFTITQFLLPQTSLLAGSAFLVTGRHKIKNVTIDGMTQYKTRDYLSLAYPFMQPDMFEIELSPKFISKNKKLQGRATLGYKTSNVSKRAGSSLRIPIAKLSTVYKLKKDLQISGIYAFNSVSSSPDSLRPSVNTSNHVIRVTPTYRFVKWGMKNTAGLILGANQYANNSDALLAPVTASTNNLGVFYRAVLGKHSGGISLNNLATRVNGNTQLKYRTLMLNARTKVLKDKASPFVRISLTRSRNATVATGSKRVFQVGTNIKATNKLQATVGISYQQHKQAIGANAPGFNEFMGRFGVNYRL